MPRIFISVGEADKEDKIVDSLGKGGKINHCFCFEHLNFYCFNESFLEKGNKKKWFGTISKKRRVINLIAVANIKKKKPFGKMSPNKWVL